MRRLFVVVVLAAATVVCWRLGFWQLSRLEEKRALNASLRATLAAPPLAAGDRAPDFEAARGRLVELAGRFDPRFQVLLRGRSHDGAPGVLVVTPWLLAGDSAAVLVERGWLPAADGATVAPGQIPDDTSRTVTGLAEPFAGGAPIPPMREMGAGSRRVWSAPRLDLDSLRARLPYAIAPYALRALPGGGAPERPLRAAPRPTNEITNLGYAVQWFAMGVVLPLGSLLLARRRRAASRDSVKSSA